MNNLSITPLGMIFLLYTLHLILKNGKVNDKLVKLFTLQCGTQMLMLQGYVLRINDQRPDFPKVLTLFIFAMLLLSRIHFNYSSLYKVMLFVIAISSGILFQLLYPTKQAVMPTSSYAGVFSWNNYVFNGLGKVKPQITSDSFQSLFIFITFALMASFFQQFATKKDLLVALKSLSNFGIIQIAVSLFELVTENLFQSSIVHDIKDILIGVGSATFGADRYREGLAEIQGLTREVSFLAFSLFLFCIVWFAEYLIYKNKRPLVLIALSCLVMLLSTSFSSLMYLGLLAIIIPYLNSLSKGKRKRFSIAQKSLILFLSAVFIMVFINLPKILPDNIYVGRIKEFLDVLSSMLNGTWRPGMASGSTTARMISIIEVFRAFLERPLIGLGLNVTLGHGAVSNSLAGFGVLGFGLWLLITADGFKSKSNRATVVFLLVVAPYIFVSPTYLTSLYFNPFIIMLIYMILTTDKGELEVLIKESLDNKSFKGAKKWTLTH